MSDVQILKDLRSLFGPVRDQGQRPTCLAFATSDTHAALRGGWSPLSCEYLFYNAQRRAGRTPTKGAVLPFMLAALKADGQPVENEWPYLSALPADLSQYGPPSGVEVFRRDGERLGSGFDEVLAQLELGRPAIVLLMLSDAFYMPQAGGVIVAPIGEGPDPERRHAMVAVAHGKVGEERAILVRNSWGPGWGSAGHGWLTESYVVPRLIRVASLTENIDVSGQNLAA